MTNDPYRQTGRTIQKLKRAIAANAYYVVHTPAMRNYILGELCPMLRFNEHGHARINANVLLLNEVDSHVRGGRRPFFFDHACYLAGERYGRAWEMAKLSGVEVR